MKLSLLFFILFSVFLTSCQTISYDKKLVEEYTGTGLLSAPFMIKELIEIYKKDTLCIKNIFNKSIHDRTKNTLYCYNVCADFFYKTLLENKNDSNKEIINQIISDIKYEKSPVKPQVDWGRVFSTCFTCPFGEYPDDRFFYFEFSILFMGEDEIKEMIKVEDGKQWKYALMAIEGGDSFTLNKEQDYKQYVLDRRMATYIIKKWENSNIKEIQDLIKAYKRVM